MHSLILPRTHWSYYSTVEELDLLIESLNVRGVRERKLKEKLNSERDRIVKSLKRSTPIIAKLSREDPEGKKLKTEGQNINEIVDLTLRDQVKALGNFYFVCTALSNGLLFKQILEMEEKIFYGTLGSLKIRDRSAWQKAIQVGKFSPPSLKPTKILKQFFCLVWIL